MYLYNVTLQRPTTITCAIQGNFTGTKQQEIVVARGQKVLELLRPDPNTGKIVPVLSVEVFGVIRSLVAFRLTGASKDFIVVGSDSGRIVILEYKPAKNVFEKIHQETFGKSGCRRIVPGQYLAVDPKGRAVMIGAIEKQKLVYILNRDAAARLTISSPLEAHKSHTLVLAAIGVDVGFENPIFACLELDYEEADGDPTGEAAQTTQMTLTFYELDLGLNHVVRKYTEPLEEAANLLIAVPGGNDGPSGVLVCSENYITYKNFGEQQDVRSPIPRRRHDLDDPERGMIFVAFATHKTKSMFFVLAQTEQGDLFKITLGVEDDMVTEIRLKYFDTVPVATSMCVLKTGFLFVASEFGNHFLYQIAFLGDNDDEPEFSSAMQLEEGETFFYAPRPLRNLVQVDEMESLSPVLNCQIADLANEDTPQLYVACGRGPRSSLRVLRHGLEVSEMAVSELPGNPNAVWTVKRTVQDEFDSYIVVSFVNATLVLSIGETVEEVTDSGFLGTTPTLSCSQLGDDALIQVYPEGIRHVRADKRVNEWKTPGKRIIEKCAVNDRQVVIALTGRELVYFEMDPSGQLNEYTERKEMTSDIICMALGPVPASEQRSRFLAVGLADNTVRIISLDPSDTLQPLSMQALPAAAESLSILQLGGSADGQEAVGGNPLGTLFLNVGLQNGVLLRTVLDAVTGDLTDTRTRYLGSRAVKLFNVKMQGKDAVLCVSSRSWLSYAYQTRFHLTPLSYEVLEYASSFSSEQCPEGIVAIAQNTLRILALEKLGAVFNQQSVPLQFTPRQFVIDSVSNNIVVVESDHNALTDQTKQERKEQMAAEMLEAAGADEREAAQLMAEEFLTENLPDADFTAAKPGTSTWSSCVRLVNPIEGTSLQQIPLKQNEGAFSIALVEFGCRPDERFIVVGTATDLTLTPRQSSGGALHVFQLLEDGQKLEFLHQTPIDGVPMVLMPFQGRLLAGIDNMIRIYDLGKKKLLRKCENRSLPNFVVSLKTIGTRIFCGDVQESVFLLKYKGKENQILLMADDTLPKWVSSLCILDYNTVAVGDKFGTINVVRLPTDAGDNVEEDPTGNRALWDRGVLNGAGQKVEVICSYHIGDTVLSMQKTTLIPGGAEAITYTTLGGAVGTLMPFTSREDIDYFQHLEMYMRQEHPPLCGRDHLHYRSYYHPLRNVIDGDLCEQFNSLDHSKRKSIAEDLDREPSEVSKKLEDMRTRHAF
ncbi:splicing factor 3B subunit 3-like [Sycon ciliatum]|uniref:splicing factor 3B subunit 3-like n=1 Tax=Sycon ciliatum TaxID=27933 RepID=UPI0020AE6A41|eukprot:scpid13660/ scgid29605/ Splicing factor 3B subunit 3; Pre-mRNA-splicing factor SF3b 130 kDa subunit; Spliceosome-associated protein 130